MKTLNYFLVAFAVLAVLVVVSPARAELLFSYSFDNLNSGPPSTDGSGPNVALNGQDGWRLMSEINSNWPNGCYPSAGMEIIPGPVGSDTTQVVKHPLNNGGGSNGFSGNWKAIGPFTFTAADTNVTQTFQMMSSNILSGSMRVPLIWDGEDTSKEFSGGWGTILVASGKPGWVDRGGNGTVISTYAGTVLTNGDWYEFRGEMDFSVPGGQITVSYRDLTAGSDWVTEDALKNLAMNVNPIYVAGQPTYTVTGISIMDQRGPYTQYYDNFALVNGAVPEPSTLALLACGLIGLLAYAWRKRK